MSASTARYVDVLSRPGVPMTFGAALIGRAAYALVFLPLFYAVAEATDSVGLAGTAVAAYGATASLLAPVRAWAIDRFGARPVLTVLTSLFAGSLTALALVSVLGGGGVVLIVFAGVAGAFAPPLGPTMRVAWGELAPDGAWLRKGLSLDAVVEELLYLAGPAIAGLGLTVMAPGPALLAPAALVAGGGLIFAATPAIGAMGPQWAPADSRDHGPLLLNGRFARSLFPALVAGGVVGTIGVAVPVMFTGSGGSAAAGIALGSFAAGSAVGGLLYGGLPIPGSPPRQLTVLVLALLASASALVGASGIIAVSAVLALAGLFFAPVMIVSYLAAHTSGGEHRRNAATTWVNTSHNLGSSAGSVLAGVLLQSVGGG